MVEAGKMEKSEISKHMQCVDCRVEVAGVIVRSKSLTLAMSNACPPLLTKSSDRTEYKLALSTYSKIL